MSGRESLERFLLLTTRGAWESGLPPAMKRNLEAFREAYEEIGLERGVVALAYRKVGVGHHSNFYASLCKILARAQRWAALEERRKKIAKSIESRGVPVLPGMIPSRVTEMRGADGTIKHFTVRQDREPADVMATPGEPLPGFTLKRLSTLVHSGEPTMEWQIQVPELAAKWREACEAIDERVSGIIPREPVRAPAIKSEATKLLSQITFADLHLGALGWPAETNAAPWNLDVARNSAIKAGVFLIDNLPLSEEFLLLVLGDYLDSDGYVPKTPTHGHYLDTDGRFPKISSVGLDVIETLVDYALRRFDRITIAVKPGNHDPVSSQWMPKCFERTFKSEPRVHVDARLHNSYVKVFGKTLITATHGDKISISDLPIVIACDYPEQWGQTTHRFGHVGHLHHIKTIQTTGFERAGMTVIQHPTIASRNAWAAGLGLSAARQLIGHTYRAEGGLAAKLFWHPDMMGGDE